MRLACTDDLLQLAGTDGEVQVQARVDAVGTLSPCIVRCDDLTRRLKAGREAACTLTLRPRGRQLVVNGGRVEHALPVWPAEDFPVIREHVTGDVISLDTPLVRDRLASVLPAVAQETGRYAIHGLLLESDSDGLRLVATDGRRLVIAELADVSTAFRGNVIVPARIAQLVQKFTTRSAGSLQLTIALPESTDNNTSPASLFIRGDNWALHTPAVDGRFPVYRDVVPASASRFAVARQPLLDTLGEIALATSSASRAVQLDLSPRRIKLTAHSPETGTATAQLPARFLGGGDRVIRTGFHPDYLLDALKSLAGAQVVFDVDQNGCGHDGKVFSKPALLYSLADRSVRWLIMPVHPDLAPTRTNLGSNYRPAESDAATATSASAPSTAGSQEDAASHEDTARHEAAACREARECHEDAA